MFSRLFAMLLWGFMCWYGTHLLVSALTAGVALGPNTGRSPAAFWKNDLFFACDFGHVDRDAECLARN